MKAWVTGVQYMYNLQVPDACPAGVRLFVFPVCPKSNTNTAIYLSSMEYEFAKLKKLTLQFITSAPATATGSLLCYFVPDPDWTPNKMEAGVTALAEGYESMNYVDTQVWESFDWEIALPEQKQIFTSFDREDPNETCCGHIIIMTSGDHGIDNPSGHFLLKQEWEFENRQMTLPVDSSSVYGTFEITTTSTTAYDDLDMVLFVDGANGVGLSTPPGPDDGQIVLMAGVVTSSTTTAGGTFTVSAKGYDDYQHVNLLEIGTVVWIVGTQSTDDELVYQFFGSRRAAMNAFQAVPDGSVIPRGALIWESGHAAGLAEFHLVLRGYSYIL